MYNVYALNGISCGHIKGATHAVFVIQYSTVTTTLDDGTEQQRSLARPIEMRARVQVHVGMGYN